MANLVFVYGTLKQGFPNSHLNGGVRLEGEWHSRLAYPLYLVGERYSPWLVNDPGAGSRVFGEVYRVADEELSAMDALERIQHTNGYSRKQIEVIQTETSKVIEVYAYLKEPGQLQLDVIRAGPLASYEDHHARLYTQRRHGQ